MSATDDFYRNQAKACAEAAELAQLDNQREKFLSAQRAWEALANRTAEIQAGRDARIAEQTETSA
jgi:hypothetical protein